MLKCLRTELPRKKQWRSDPRTIPAPKSRAASAPGTKSSLKLSIQVQHRAPVLQVQTRVVAFDSRVLEAEEEIRLEFSMINDQFSINFQLPNFQTLIH